VRRITEPLEGHNGGWIFYLYLLTNQQVFPFFIQLLAGMAFIILSRNFRQKYEYFFPTMMIAAILATVFIMKTRLSWYVLGIYPFAALLLGGLLTEILKYLDKNGKKRRLFRFAGYITVTALAVTFISNIYTNLVFIL
jgi:4-amino-4-deoxy-L-arabinose transferase-like glycosyltransferase